MPGRSRPLSSRVGGLTRSAPVRQVSSARVVRDAPYAAAREAVYEREDGVCEWPRCAAPMTECHHVAGRGGPDPHRLSNLVGLCADHHGWVHANPVEAAAVGLSVSRHDPVRPSRPSGDPS